ncbi:MAG TPA: carboxypeptidase regulatory-like domain-containing protein [Longimicrobium sp.]|nr:carboxypeptidase regulatory-like domain-containing protein [Longimicrobium sp.]
MLRSLGLAVALVAWLAQALPAQIHGFVRDTAGAPVPAAAVEAWSGLRRVGNAMSDASGRFSLRTNPAESVTGLVATRVGYRRASLAVTAADTVVQLRLVPASVSLEGITATAGVRACPNREDAAARAAWNGARAKYPPFTDTVVFHSLAVLRNGDVAREEIDVFGSDGGARGWTGAGTAAWEPWRQRIRRAGYALRLQRGFGEQYAFWQYAPLEMVFPQHFVDPLFGELHTFSTVASTREQTTIRFCPREPHSRSRPEIEGTLTLLRSGVLQRATWRYRTPNPDEDAGGDVDFLSPDVTARSLLLPAASRFWRKTMGGRYYVQSATYQEWRLYPGMRAPPVPAGVSAVA